MRRQTVPNARLPRIHHPLGSHLGLSSSVPVSGGPPLPPPLPGWGLGLLVGLVLSGLRVWVGCSGAGVRGFSCLLPGCKVALCPFAPVPTGTRKASPQQPFRRGKKGQTSGKNKQKGDNFVKASTQNLNQCRGHDNPLAAAMHTPGEHPLHQTIAQSFLIITWAWLGSSRCQGRRLACPWLLTPDSWTTRSDRDGDKPGS